MEQKKVFRGERNGKININMVTLNNEILQPKEFNGLPLAFDWGNKSLEAKQLAYSILSAVYDIDIARRFYLEFTDEVINDMVTEHWTLPEKIIRKEVKVIGERML